MKLQPGYVTEKLLEPLAAGSVPIYWGGSHCAEDFDPAAFINADDFRSQDQLIRYVEHVNNNQDLWQQYTQAPVFRNTRDWPVIVFNIIYQTLIKNKPQFTL